MNTRTLNVNEPLEYSIRIKDNAEFILVKEGMDIEEFTSNLNHYLDIDTNADSYTIDWLGQSLCTSTIEKLKTYEGKELLAISGIQSTARDKDYHPIDTRIFYLDKENKYSKEATLNYDSFRPIKLVIDFNKDGEIERVYKTNILSCRKRL